jgi:acetyltransferase-like isoleucine patch superfamily enzyme
MSEPLDRREADPDLVRSWLASRLLALHRGPVGMGQLARIFEYLEGGPMRSATLRQLLEQRFGVRVGAFSYGACIVPGAFHPGLVVGRYVSMASYVRWGLDHPLDRPFLHPAFYQRAIGLVDRDHEPRGTLAIHADAWIGDMVVITTGCQRIGVGAVIGAGSVVTHDVPDFAIAYGAPARIVRRRFDDATCEALLRSRWWELSPAELREWRDVADLAAASSAVGDALEKIAVRVGRIRPSAEGQGQGSALDPLGP